MSAKIVRLGEMLFIQTLEFWIFKSHDVIKFLSVKQEIHFTEYLGKQTKSVNDIWPVYVILQKKKILQKLQPEN